MTRKNINNRSTQYCTHNLNLPVRLLEPRAGTTTAELLRLGTTVIRNKEGAVVLDESLLQLVLGILIDVFLIVGNDRLGNGLSDSIDLRDVTTTRDPHADVDSVELVKTNYQDGLVDLHMTVRTVP